MMKLASDTDNSVIGFYFKNHEDFIKALSKIGGITEQLGLTYSADANQPISFIGIGFPKQISADLSALLSMTNMGGDALSVMMEDLVKASQSAKIKL